METAARGEHKQITTRRLHTCKVNTVHVYNVSFAHLQLYFSYLHHHISSDSSHSFLIPPTVIETDGIICRRNMNGIILLCRSYYEHRQSFRFTLIISRMLLTPSRTSCTFSTSTLMFKEPAALATADSNARMPPPTPK